MEKNRYPVLTIDGASGVGKGTVAQLLAQFLGFHFLDSGALYRVLAMAAKKHQVVLDNELALEVLARHLDVQFKQDENLSTSILLEGENVTDLIRTEEISHMASQVAALPCVRIALLERQRAFCEAPGLVADGRDMGTVIFPNAMLKVFLIASPEIRAQRRLRQLEKKGVSNVSFEQVLHDINQRDARDSSRKVSPLKPAKDATVIDTSDLSVTDVFEAIKRLIDEKLKN
jgi:CMP/dCMP kinase